MKDSQDVAALLLAIAQTLEATKANPNESEFAVLSLDTREQELLAVVRLDTYFALRSLLVAA